MDHYYCRHLPHEVPEGAIFFVTWNLKGAMPAEAVQRLQAQRERLQQTGNRPGESPRERKIREGKILFGMADKLLDNAESGPLYLKDPQAAKFVEDSIRFGVGERYDLYAWCVMANHVHVVFKPIWKLFKVMQGLKGYTAHEINGLQGARGRVFWQDESYDHWVRDDEELRRIIWYVESNPVAAKLCSRPEDWPWSSARFRAAWPVGQPFQADIARSDPG
jgi:putative transposase